MYDAMEEAQFSAARPVSRLVHDAPEMRVVVFGLEAGQELAPHTAPARVLLHVVQGRGAFITGRGEEPAHPGAFAVSEPNELHGFRAEERTALLAVIAPRP
jgi:quercetin dioxygenase-like cupin family protein